MRKICVFTGTRAEYGLLYWVMKYIQEDPELILQTVVSGAHLSERLGETWKQIDADGFTINAKIPMDLEDDSGVGLARSMGEELIGLSNALDELKPDVLVLLGDRYEAFIAATAAMMLRIPIAHIHGGEATEGAIDEAIRHAITKMSHIHFPAAEEYRQRIIQMGEKPEYVINTGAPGLDNIEYLAYMSKKELSAAIGFDLSGDVALVTYHPVTLTDESPERGVEALLRVLHEQSGLKVVFTEANADMSGKYVNAVVREFVKNHEDRMLLVSTLGQRRYLSLMREAVVVVGNSSSGIIEAPAIGTPTINIGIRQQGRLRADSIVDCDDTYDAIMNAFDIGLSKETQILAQKKKSPYGSGGASKKIVQTLKNFNFKGLLIKKFMDHQ